jgi:hypothetical protein
MPSMSSKNESLRLNVSGKSKKKSVRGWPKRRPGRLRRQE